MSKVTGAAFRSVDFLNCKLLGLHFDDCNTFLLSFSFEDCVLNFSSFYKLKLKKTIFRNCKLEEVEFMESDLSNSVFENCELSRAIFDNTILTNTDFRTSYNFSIDPEANKMDKAKFSVLGLSGLLNKYNIIIE